MDKKIGDLSDRDFAKVIQLYKEASSGARHEFSLVAVKKQDGKYLQLYDNRWECWLFPSVRSTDNNKENVDNFVKEKLKIESPVKYVTSSIHCKFSVSDNVYKIYNHKLYIVQLSDTDEVTDRENVSITDSKLKWMSISEMEKDENIMQKNEEIIAFVKANCE